ncbi:hypothetical protein RI367_006062 [Sorochytrium milnesiophthora]
MLTAFVWQGSSSDFDVTPCFSQSIILAVPSALLLLTGGARLLYVSKRPTLFPLTTRMHVKLAGYVTATLISLVLLVLAAANHSDDGSLLLSSCLSFAALVLATVLARAEHIKYDIGPMLLTGFWVLRTVTHAAALRTYADHDVSSTDPIFVLTALSTAVSAVLMLVEGFWSTAEGVHANAEACAAPFVRATFMWMAPIMRLGNKRVLTMGDTAKLNSKLQSHRLYEQFLKAKTAPGNSKALPMWSLLWQLHSLILLSVLTEIGGLIVIFIQPMLVNSLLAFIKSYSTLTPQPAADGYILAVGILVMSILQGVLGQHHMHCSVNIRARLQPTLMNAVYRKAMRLSLVGQKNVSSGEIVNHMSVDAAGLVSVIDVANNSWSSVVTIIVALVQLWKFLGWAPLCGLAIFLVVSPVLGWAGSAVSKLHDTKMLAMDERIKLVSEVISGMRMIKLYATEHHYIQKITEYRNKEQNVLRKAQAGLSAVFGIVEAMSTVIAVVSFGIYAVTTKGDAPLDSTRVFVSLLYFRMLDSPLNSFLGMFAMGTRSLVSYRRLAGFMASPEIDQDAIVYNPDATSSPVAARISDGSFSWHNAHKPDEPKPKDQTKPESSDVFSLTDINVDFERGKLTAIAGRVGQGKTSLLHALLGEMVKQHGRVEVNGRVAYVAQQAWIVNGTLRENILMGQPMNERLYRRTLYACSLVPDLKVLEQGDMTPIGDKGVNLSGGQKARVSLARAVYSQADIYLLDDCLSAVDAHVDKHIFRHVIGSCGMLSGKTVIMVTHGVHHLPQCDQVVFLRDGTITEQGTFDELMSSGGDVHALVTDYSIKKRPITDDDSATLDNASNDKITPDLPLEHDLGKFVETDLHLDFPLVIQAAGEVPLRADDDNTSGTVSWSVYKEYMLAMGKGNVLIGFLLMAGYTSVMAGSQLWLEHVASASDANHPLPLGVALGGLVAFTVGMMIFNGLGSYWILVRLCIKACKVLHQRLLQRVFRAQSGWLDRIPAGRIVNRFSSDTDSLDETVPWAVLNALVLGVAVLANVILIVAPLPWMAIPLLVSFTLLSFIQRYFLKSSRELKRLDSGSKAPIYQQFGESVGGLVTVRAYKYEAQITDQIESKINNYMQAQYTNYASNRWLGVSVNLIGSVINFGVAIIPVFLRHTATGAQVGLGFVGAQSLVNFTMWLLRSTCELEASMIATERVIEYSKVPIEAALHDATVETNWPSSGSIAFKNYTTAYQSPNQVEPAKPVLKNLNLVIHGGEKIGICGRTGAGKSTITLSLFRLIEAVSGSIEIDGQDIARVGLADLRSRLTIIPQDPMLFQGTLRTNLDPLGKHTDVEVWRALEHASLKEYIATLEGGLEAKVENGGNNFSAGQKQLLTLAAALLRKQRIVIFDEATSATDAETDAIVQRTIRSEFRDCTVLTIAHRIATILDSDRILVLDQGQVAEFDTPQALLQNPESAFAKLVESAQTH